VRILLLFGREADLNSRTGKFNQPLPKPLRGGAFLSCRQAKMKVKNRVQSVSSATAEPTGTPARREGTNGGDAQKYFESIEFILEYILKTQDPDRAGSFIDNVIDRLRAAGLPVPPIVSTPYINTIPPEQQPEYPGNNQLERRIKSITRWNAMAMVVNANRNTNVGGHISSFASSATLYEVGYNHFFRGGDDGKIADLIYFQGHATPGNYARAFLEGRLSEKQLQNFRQELAEGGGLSSYPHPYLMPEFWQFPTVSMGLGPIMSLYQARFIRYMKARGLLPGDEPKVWCFMGDGESDEPESLGALTLGSREMLDNLIWVVNCNLQRLDGPVRGNGKIIQELESRQGGTLSKSFGAAIGTIFSSATTKVC
jgi:pyruvate dehydrogenase E1 component